MTFRRVRGHAMLLCVIFLALFVVLTSLMFSQALRRVYYSRHAEYAQRARWAAEAALARTVAKLRKSSAFVSTVAVKYEDSSALVHFDAKQPYASLNNLSGSGGGESSQPLPGSSILVFPDQAHLVSVGECHGVQIVTQIRLSKPPWPFAIYASGAFRSTGGLLLGAVRPGTDVHNFEKSDLLPAELLANSSEADSLYLDGVSTIVGNAKTPGTAFKGDKVEVLLGDVFPGARGQDPPILKLASYDPSGHTGVQTLSQSNYAVREPMSGLVRSSNSLTFQQGLELKGGLLYVDGDVVIESGGIRGQGLLVATGKVTIKGGSDFAADSRCAVLAGGDLSLKGAGQDSAYFQGLLMANGSGGIDVSGVTLMGAAVASSPSGAKVEIANSRLLYDEKATHVSGEVGFPAGVYPPRGFGSQDPVTGQTTYLRLKPVTLAGPPPQTVTNPTPATFVAAGVGTLSANQFELVDSQGNPVDGEVSQALGNVDDLVGKMTEAINAVKTDDPLLPGGKFDFDLNRFVNVEDQLRIIWRN